MPNANQDNTISQNFSNPSEYESAAKHLANVVKQCTAAADTYRKSLTQLGKADPEAIYSLTPARAGESQVDSMVTVAMNMGRMPLPPVESLISNDVADYTTSCVKSGLKTSRSR